MGFPTSFLFIKTNFLGERLMLYQLKLTLALILSSTIVLSGCSIKDETSQEIKVQRQELINPKPKTKTQRFINLCSECILGDLSKLDEIVATYQSSFTPKTNYPKGAFLYQKITPTLAFERCAQKAMLLGDNRAFNAMFIRQGKIARTARYFYATNKPTQGAFWLQRIINVKGEMDGLEVAGRVFIQDIRTIGIGVRLLEQSARLGNRNARQMLMGLMNPGSVYYQQLTKNSLHENEDDQSAEAIDHFDSQVDDPDQDQAKGQAPGHANGKGHANGQGLAKSATPVKNSKTKSQPILDDEDNAVLFNSALPLTDSEVNSKSKIEEVQGGQISLYNSQSQEQSANKPKNSLDSLAQPKNMGLGYTETAIKANNQPKDATTSVNSQEQNASLLNSTEATISALESLDPELDMPLELYEQDHESHQQSLKQQEEKATADGSIIKARFGEQRAKDREAKLKALEQKALEVSQAAQKKAQEATNSQDKTTPSEP